MNKISILSLILVSALFLSACGVKENGSSTTTPSLQQEEAKTSSFSLQDLIAKNTPQKCTWSNTVEDSESSGVVTINGHKFNQKVTIKQGDIVSSIYSISDGEYIYTWQESNDQKMASNAFKTKLNLLETDTSIPEVEENQATIGQAVDYNQQYEYKCSPTTITESDFQVPKDIEFIDYSQFLEDLQDRVPSINLGDYEQFQ